MNEIVKNHTEPIAMSRKVYVPMSVAAAMNRAVVAVADARHEPSINRVRYVFDISFPHPILGLTLVSVRLLSVTETLLRAINNAASSGLTINPVAG